MFIKIALSCRTRHSCKYWDQCSRPTINTHEITTTSHSLRQLPFCGKKRLSHQYTHTQLYRSEHIQCIIWGVFYSRATLWRKQDLWGTRTPLPVLLMLHMVEIVWQALSVVHSPLRALTLSNAEQTPRSGLDLCLGLFFSVLCSWAECVCVCMRGYAKHNTGFINNYSNQMLLLMVRKNTLVLF